MHILQLKQDVKWVYCTKCTVINVSKCHEMKMHGFCRHWNYRNYHCWLCLKHLQINWLGLNWLINVFTFIVRRLHKVWTITVTWDSGKMCVLCCMCWHWFRVATVNLPEGLEDLKDEGAWVFNLPFLIYIYFFPWATTLLWSNDIFAGSCETKPEYITWPLFIPAFLLFVALISEHFQMVTNGSVWAVAYW